jgi:hypothetical protein
VRDVINLSGASWREAIGDTIDLSEIPSNLEWSASEVPTERLGQKLKSADNQSMYNNVAPGKYIDEQGNFKVQEDRSAWYRRKFDIDATLMSQQRAYLTVAGMSYRSAVFINGVQAGESIQSNVPLEFDITDFLHAGTNEIVLVITTREGIVDPDAAVYLSPSMGALVGIRGPIRLEFRPTTFVDDVFVKTSVQNKNIDFEISVLNQANTSRILRPEVRVKSYRDPLNIVASFSSEPVRLSTGVETVFNLKENWVAPILWSPTSPEIYVAEVSLYDGDRLVDRYEQTFGFREFTINGKDFLLNGKRVVLLRETSLSALGTLEQAPDRHAITFEYVKEVNSIRQHLGANDTDLIHRANLEGILVIPEAAYSWVSVFPHNPDQVKVWLPGVLDYYKRWARQMRNEPSVVIYSVANETYWQRNLPEEMFVAKQIVEVMKENDPTRPLQADGDNDWNKLLDITNIHYPEGTAGTLRLEYPHSGLQIPNDLYWITTKGGKGWRTDFTWDRPLILGEFGGGGEWDSYTSYGGDDVYDWIKWRQNTRDGHDQGGSNRDRDNYYLDGIHKMTNIYRHMGVAGLTPWTGDKAVLLKALAVAPLDFQANVDAGGTFRRKLAAFNDGVRPINAIEYFLTIDGQMVEEGKIDFYVNPGQKWSQTVEVPVPNVAVPTEAEFLVRLYWKRGSKYIEVDRYTESVYIVPEFDLSNLAQDLVIVDPKGTLADRLSRLGLERAMRLTGTTIPNSKRMVLFGEDAYRSEYQNSLDDFVEAGGVALLLPQDNWRPYRPELPERDLQHAATQSWARMPNHPALKDIQEDQLRYWNEDNVVSYGTFKKPQFGPIQIVADTGGRYGLSWSPLMDIPIGQGAYLMTTYELASPEPVAGQLLANLIEYGVNRAPRLPVQLNLLAGQNKALREAVDFSGAKYTTELSGSGPILVDASADFSVADLRRALDQGRTLWLHDFTPETLGKVASLLPADAALQAVSDDLLGTMWVREDSLTTGLATYDLTWYAPKLYGSGHLFDSASVTADAGDWALDVNPFAEGITQLTQPGYLMKIDVGDGTLLFDTLKWEHAVAQLPSKTLRLLSGILTNLGVGFELEAPVEYAFDFVDLAEFANMSYMDRIADDGVGGWSDQGRNDMRFFLINHSGKGNGEEDGMDMPVPDFPTDMEFGDVAYHLVDPQANGNKAVLSFGSEKHAPTLMREVGAIPVNAKADRLWALHAIGWSGGKTGDIVAEYTLHYTDGSTAMIPVRRFIDVGDWHNPAAFPNATVAWTGSNLMTSTVGVNASSWKNPHPEKLIESISLNAGLSDSQYLLLALTLGREVSDSTVVLDLNFEDGTGLSELSMKEPKPTLEASGLRFVHGTQAKVRREDLDADLLQTPFSVTLDFTATEIPDGHYGGLLETGPFRIMLHHFNMHLCIQTKDASGQAMEVKSSEPVALGERVEFEFKMDGNKGILLRNGRVDTIVDASLPGYPLERMRFGVAGGQDYNFNGVLHRVTLAALTETGS